MRNHNYNLMSNFFVLNETFANSLNYNLPSSISVALIICFICFIIILGVTVYLSTTEGLIPESNLNISRKFQEQNTNERGNIDIRYGIIQSGVTMSDHSNSQTNTPNRQSVFFYDGNNRSGSTIVNMPFSNRMQSSFVTVNVNGIPTRGFYVFGSGIGPNGSRMLKINPHWLLESQVHSTVTTLTYPLVGSNQGYAILSSNPIVTSFEPMRISSITD